MQTSANMNPRAELHQSAPQRHRPCNIECGDDLPAGADLDPVARADPHQCIVRKGKAVLERHAEMVHKFQRGGAGASLLSVDYDEVRVDIRCKHRLAYRKEFPGMADAEFETCWLAAGQLPHLANELHQLDGRGKRGMA